MKLKQTQYVEVSESSMSRGSEMALPLFKSGDEVVSVTERRYEYFPASFVWREQPFQVQSIRRCWTSVRRDLAGRPNEYHHFRVRTTDGTFVLTRDLRRNRWTLATDSGSESRAAA
jgi:hypothetical protein